MSSLSIIECCHLLAIDPKTLRQWVVQAQMGLHTDPTNAKIKCLEVEQVQSLARLHGRVLKPEASASALSLRTSEVQIQGRSTALPDADLQARLAQMEAQVATLQTQITDLALQLLKRAGAAHRAASACSGGAVFLKERTVSCFANWICGISVRPASHASAGVPFPQATNASDPAH